MFIKTIIYSIIIIVAFDTTFIIDFGMNFQTGHNWARGLGTLFKDTAVNSQPSAQEEKHWVSKEMNYL